MIIIFLFTVVLLGAVGLMIYIREFDLALAFTVIYCATLFAIGCIPYPINSVRHSEYRVEYSHER